MRNWKPLNASVGFTQEVSIMENMSHQALAALLLKYLDIEALMKENPSVTKEMIGGFLLDASTMHQNKETADTRQPSRPVPRQKHDSAMELIIHTDGASRGNPGKAGIGVAIYDRNYVPVEEVCKYIGESTNNVAEYQAMILAAQKAIAHKARKVTFKTDSELLVRQLNGLYRVKSPNILPLYNELITFLKKIPEWKMLHVRREENACADALANQGIDTAHRQGAA